MMDTRERLAKVISDWGIDALTSNPPHGWRCEYPETYGKGPCRCVDQLLDDLEMAAAGSDNEETNDG